MKYVYFVQLHNICNMSSIAQGYSIVKAQCTKRLHCLHWYFSSLGMTDIVLAVHKSCKGDATKCFEMKLKICRVFTIKI